MTVYEFAEKLKFSAKETMIKNSSTFLLVLDIASDAIQLTVF